MQSDDIKNQIIGSNNNIKKMSHIKAELHEQSIPLYSIRLIEAHRIFDMIQENIPDPKSALTVRNIECFLEKYYFADAQQKATKLMYQLNREGLEMTSDRFAASMAKYLKNVQLTNEQSLGEFYIKVKGVLCLTYQKPSQQYELWDIDQDMTPQSLRERQNNIGIFYSELQPYIDGMQLFTFQSYLQRLNYCLSVISISTIESEVFKVYRTFINPTVMNHLSDFFVTIGQLQTNQLQLNSELLQIVLSQKENVVRYFGLISHFYSACKYRQLKEKLQTTPCLFYHETFKTIISALNIPEVKIQRQVAICLSVMSKYVDAFNDWILSDIFNNLMLLLTSFGGMKDESATYYSLICLKNIIKRYQKKSQLFKSDKKNHQILEKIQIFSMYFLSTYGNIELQKECLLLIAEVLKVCPVNYKQIEELKITTKVFEVQLEYQAALVPATLAILEVAIHRKLDDITNMIINDPAFLVCLQTHYGVKESVFFYQFLHIVYLLSYTHTNFLFEKDLLTKTVNIMFDEINPTVSSIGSDILLNAVQQGLQNEQILEILYDKLFILDRVIPLLFKKCFAKSPYLDILVSENNLVPNYTYFDKYILNNFFKILYSLAVGVNRRHKKFAFLRRVNEEIINSISNILDDLFKSDNRNLIEIVLREKIRITNSKKIKLENGIPLFKVITIILEEMTYNMENRPLTILKTINHEIKSFGQNLLKSQVFTLHELEVENIPLYIKVDIEYDDRRYERSIPHKFELGALKTYIKTFLIKETDRKVSDVRDVILKFKQNGRIIENEVQYRALVNKVLESRVTEFAWYVQDVKWKNRREDIIVSSFVLPNYEPGMRTYREPNQFATSRIATTSRQVPNIGVSRYNNTMRQTQEDSYARRNYSPINFNYTYDRARSPAFGGSGGNRNR